MCANIRVEVVVCIVSRSYMVDQLLIFMSTMVEKPDVFGKFFVAQFVIAQVFPEIQISKLVSGFMITW